MFLRCMYDIIAANLETFHDTNNAIFVCVVIYLHGNLLETFDTTICSYLSNIYRHAKRGYNSRSSSTSRISNSSIAIETIPTQNTYHNLSRRNSRSASVTSNNSASGRSHSQTRTRNKIRGSNEPVLCHLQAKIKALQRMLNTETYDS